VQIADGFSAARLTFDGRLERTGKITDPGFPGYIRGLAAADRGVYVTNSAGAVGRWNPDGWTEGEVWVDGLGEVMGLAALPGTPSVAVAVADHRHVVSVSPGGQVATLADGFQRPVAVAAGAAGELFVTDEARGTLERVERGRRTVLAEGLNHPHDLVAREAASSSSRPAPDESSASIHGAATSTASPPGYRSATATAESAGR
jgi:hypothetical protein